MQESDILKLAEKLLYKSCKKALERIKDKNRIKYRGVKCEWSKPKEMKKVLMSYLLLWNEWIKLTEIYIQNGMPNGLRPTIDRIESNPNKGGHYYLNNIQALSYSDNCKKDKGIPLDVFVLEKDFISYKTFNSIQETMNDLNISRKLVSENRSKGLSLENGENKICFIQNSDGSINENTEFNQIINLNVNNINIPLTTTGIYFFPYEEKDDDKTEIEN
jgi:hypothetical protein